MENVIFLLSKDCMPCESLRCYGGSTYWNTPNIDALAQKGTVYRKHYAAGTSTAMSMSAMLSGKYPYEFESRNIYVNVKPEEHPSIYAYYQQLGYECHLIWDKGWIPTAWRFVREFGDETKTVIHNLSISQSAGSYRKDHKPLVQDDALLQCTYDQIFTTLKEIDLTKKQFIWLHLPHVLKGRCSYMGDMDAFDHVVGFVRDMVGDDSIYLTTDHGHMNMHKGLVCYGFHAYEPVTHIPLITPRVDGLQEVNYLTCNVDVPILLKEKKLPPRDVVISDTAYKAQPHRTIAISDGRFKYIYNKKDRSEELYDLQWDPHEEYNILLDDYYDKNRGKRMIYCELYFYPYRQEALEQCEKLRSKKDEIWREGPVWISIYGRIRKVLVAVKKVFFG